MFLPFSLFGRTARKLKKSRSNAMERKGRLPRLKLEELEERAVPAIYFVDITNPSMGTGTALDPFKYIQTAIQAANSNPGQDTIVIYGNNSNDPAHVYVWTRDGDADGDGQPDGSMIISNNGTPGNELTVIFRAQSLLVNPGAPAPLIVKMKDNIIDVGNGCLLRVEGQQSARVIFTSYVDDSAGGDTNGDGSINLPNRADWGGIRYRAGAASQSPVNSGIGALINWADIRFSGASMYDEVVGYDTEFAGVRMEADPVTGQFNQTRIWNTIFRHGGRAIDVNVLSLAGRGPDLGFNALNVNGVGSQPLSFENNTINGCFVFVPFDNNPASPRFGQVVQLNQSSQWDDVGVPYVLTQRIVLAHGITLTIDPGMVIKAQRVNIDGADVADTTNSTRATIQVNGRPELPVLFTSLSDDNIFLPNTDLHLYYNNGSRDTNNDGSTTTPQPGDWGGIRIPNGHIDFAFVRYGGGLIPIAGQFVNHPAVQVFSRDLTPSGGPLHSVRVANTEIAFTFTGSVFGLYYDSPALDIIANSTYFSFINPRPEGTRDARMGDVIIIDNFIRNNQGKAIQVDPLAFHERRNPVGGYGVHFRRNIIRDNAINGAYIRHFLEFLPDAIRYQNLPLGGGYFDDTDIVLAMDGQALAVFPDQTFQLMSRRGVEPSAAGGTYIDRYQRTSTQTDAQALTAFLTQGLVMRLPGFINIPLERGPVSRNASLVDSGLFYYLIDFETTARNVGLAPNLQNNPAADFLYGNEWRDWGVNFSTGAVQSLRPFYTRGNYGSDPDPLGPPVSGTNMLANADPSGNGSIDLTFPNGVSAVGFWIIGNESTSANEQIQFIAADGSIIDSMPLPTSAPGTNRAFVGRVSRTPIHRVRIIEDANDSAGGMFSYTGSPVAIGAGATITVNLNISASFNLSRVGVGLNVNHNRVNDLIVSLRSPNGTVVQLANRPGGATGPAGANFSGTYFDDGGAVNIANGVAPYTGTYQPTSPLSAFNGQNVNGTWQLIIQNVGSTTGSLQNFSLNFQSASLAPDSIAIDDLYYVDAPQSLVVKAISTDTSFASGGIRSGFAGVQQNAGGAITTGFVPNGIPYTITGTGTNARATGTGGAFRILGQSQHPVVLTSILDSTVGAGPIGTQSFNRFTLPNEFSVGVPGSWTGIQVHPGTNFHKSIVTIQQPSGQVIQRYADINPYTLGDEGPTYLPGQTSYQDVFLSAGLHSLITSSTQTVALVQDGAFVEYADIRFATVGIEQKGYPDHKLTIEGNEVEQNRNNPNESRPGNAFFQPMPGMMNRVGDGARVFETPSGAYRVSARLGGFLESPTSGTDDVDWFELPQAPSGSTYQVYIDVQRGLTSGAGNDGPGGPVGIAVYNAQFQLIYWSGTTAPLVPFRVQGPAGASLANSGNALGPIIVRDEQDQLYDTQSFIRDARYVAILPAGRRPSLFVPTQASPPGTFPQDNTLVFIALPAAGPPGSNGFAVAMEDQEGNPVAMPSDDYIWDPPGPSGSFLGGYEVEFRTEGFTNRSARPIRAGDGEFIIRNNIISSSLDAAIRLSDSRATNLSNENLGPDMPQQAARFARDNATQVLNTNGVPFTNPSNFVVGATIYNNLIIRGLGNGITITEDTSRPAPNLFTPTGFIHVMNNTLDNNAGTGIAVTGRGGTMMFNNIITNSATGLAYNKLPNIDATNPILPVFSYNLLFGNTSNIAPGSTINATQNLLNVNPQYVDATNLDYRLLYTSPAVDSAISEIADRLAAVRFPQEPSRAPVSDIRGRFRIDNPNRPNVGAGQFPFYDRGAFEVNEPVLRVVGLNVYSSNGLLSAPVSQLVVRFFGRVDVSTVNSATVRVTQGSLTGPVIGLGPISNSYDPLTNIHTFVITLQTQLNQGIFCLQLKGTSTGPTDPGIRDISGNLLDGEFPPPYNFPSGNGVAGGTFIYCFAIRTASISGLVWNNPNGDLIQQSGEPGLAGVQVQLTWAGEDGIFGTSDDQNLPSQSTNANGQFSFIGLQVGNYRVQVNPSSVPAGFFLNTPPNPKFVTVGFGQDLTGVNFGYWQDFSNAQIGNLVWNDLNGDGIRQTGEPGLANILVIATWAGRDRIFGTADDQDFFTTSFASGAYSIANLPAGDYRVNVDPSSVPPGFNRTFPATVPYTFVLTPGQTLNNINFGFQQASSSIGDLVFNDLNGNGVHDLGEPGIGGVQVLLFRGSTLIATQTTDGAGNYLFSNLTVGNYTVVVNTSGVLSGFYATTTNPLPINLPDGNTQITTADFGFALDPMSGSLGSLVFDDLNGNGVHDLGEPGLVGVTVNALWAGRDGIFGTNPFTLVNDDQTFSITSGAGGAYSLTNLPVGTYRVSTGAGVPAGFGPTTPQPINVTLGPGGSRTDVNFGFQATNSAITGVVFNDFNFNGLLDGTDTGFGAGVRVIIDLNLNGVHDPGEPFAITGAGGVYTISSLAAGTYRVLIDPVPGSPAGLVRSPAFRTVTVPSSATVTGVNLGLTQRIASLTGRVFMDQNSNGIQDSGEIGVGGVTVTLTWYGPDNIFGTADDQVFTQLTNSSGQYNFTQLVGAFAAGNNYRVEVDQFSPALPIGSVPTVPNPPVVNLRIQNTSPGPNYTQNFGFRAPASSLPGVYYLTLAGVSQVSSFVGGLGTVLPINDTDILRLDTNPNGDYQYSVYLRGANIGLTPGVERIDAFTFLNDGSIVISTAGSFSVNTTYVNGVGSGPVLTGNGEDLLRFIPTSIGEVPSGTWSILFRGSQVGLSGAQGNIDAVSALYLGGSFPHLLISTVGQVTVSGISAGNFDVLRFAPTSLGTTTRGSFFRFFSGASVGLNDNVNENIDALFVQPGSPLPQVFLSTTGSFSVPNQPLTGTRNDVLHFVPTSLGNVTAGQFVGLQLVGANVGLTTSNLTGIYIGTAPGPFPGGMSMPSGFSMPAGFSMPELTSFGFDGGTVSGRAQGDSGTAGLRQSVTLTPKAPRVDLTQLATAAPAANVRKPAAVDQFFSSNVAAKPKRTLAAQRLADLLVGSSSLN